jgi:hypothetical protein
MVLEKRWWDSRETLGRSGGSFWSGIGVVSGSHLWVSVVHVKAGWVEGFVDRAGGGVV